MYSDLFDALGGGGGSQNASTSTSSRGGDDREKPIISFKAGKVEMALQENGKYLCVPDTRRGEVNLRYSSNNTSGTNAESNESSRNARRRLVWEWYDRREKTVVDTIPITTDGIQLQKAYVPPSQDASQKDRVYYWKLDNEWKMIWLQDKEEDLELISKVNDILKSPLEPAAPAAPEGETAANAAATTTRTTTSTGTNTTAAASGGPVSARSPGNASTSSVSTTTRQVDALSNILENLGMPQGETHNPTAAGGAAASATTTSTTAGSTDAPAPAAGTLTLADLQGVMAGLQQQQSGGSGGMPGLQDIVTSDAIKDLLANEQVKERLLAELPEGQRDMEHLEANLLSPQVQQTLRSLTSALVPDDNGSMDGYHSVIANFQLDANAGQATLESTNNPIQAFLDCVLASVEKEEGKEDDEEGKEVEMDAD